MHLIFERSLMKFSVEFSTRLTLLMFLLILQFITYELHSIIVCDTLQAAEE